MTHKFTYGPTKTFVPICIRHPRGFYGGPAGYEERDSAEDAEPVIVEAKGKGDQDMKQDSVPK